METRYSCGLVWLRRDLRVHDNTALAEALAACASVHVAFVFDTSILGALPRQDRRVEFILAAVQELDGALREAGGEAVGLIARHGAAATEIPQLAAALGVQAVFAAFDDEPQALARDAAVRTALASKGIPLHLAKDHMVFARSELRTQAGGPYSVFTPYKRAWLSKVQGDDLAARTALDGHRLAARPAGMHNQPTLQGLGFAATNLAQLAIPTGESGARQLLEDFKTRMKEYHHTRDFPARKGPSYLSVHLRFGTVSVRELARLAHARGGEGAATWLGELIWRDFYLQVLANFPHVADADGSTHSFRPEYDAIRWDEGVEADALFESWCEGRTGYPLVDAAMLQLNQTGYMHNRLRMVTASFLIKDLGIDWRRGERYFADKLNDFDLAANNGGWQWASSSGCDAQPWFRIFNPVTQSRKFDADGKFILRYLPQLARLPADALHAPWLARPVDLQAAGIVLGKTYPLPVVDHEKARQRTLARYGAIKPATAPA
jgi:deoxyribodipyrimidine photo-lyase